MVIVQLGTFGQDGDALYRVHEPARALARLPGVTVVDAHLLGRHAFALARRADLLILHFANDWGLADLVRDRRAAGRPTVFEANDDFFDLQPWNPIASAWADEAVPALYRHLLREADGVQASTPHLAGRWRTLGARDVAVFANHLADLAPSSPERAGPLTIGWAGSPGHFADLYWIAPTLTRWLEAHPAARLALMTAEPARDFFALPPERFHFSPFGTRAEYLAFLGGLDIGIAPLLPTAYNRGRSDVKHLEYAACGVVGLYSDLGPYWASVRPGETGLLFGDLAELRAGLDRLGADAALRASIRAGAFADVARDRRLADHISARLAWYESLVARAGPAGGEGLHPLTGYHAVDLDPAEAPLARPDAADPREAERLDALLAAAPDHRPALLRRARGHLAAGDGATALGLLQAGLDAYPDDSEFGAELGRALYRGGDVAAARQRLDATLARVPSSLPAWRYRLRLAALTGEPGAAELGEQARRALPESGEIALLSAEVLPETERAEALSRVLESHGAGNPGARQGAFAARLAATLREVLPLEARETLLRKACASFPESADLRAALGSTLRRLGRDVEGLVLLAGARGSAALGRVAPDRDADLVAQLAEHVLDHAPEARR